ncbi:ATPase [Aureococcus anophagefferens]|nr:ATPase [Aureococcus anophagefferens]
MFIYQAASTPLCVVMPLERAVVLRDYRNGVFSRRRAGSRVACINGVIISFLACAIVYPACHAHVPGAHPQNQFPDYFLPLKYVNLLTWSVKYLMVQVFAHTTDKAGDILESPVYFDISEGNVDSCVPMMFLLFGALFAAGFVVTTAAQPAGRRRARPAPRRKVLDGAKVADLAAEASEPLLGGARRRLRRRVPRRAPASVASAAITLWRGVRSPGKKATLHDVSVSFEAKTTTALMGPSGAGKTTLIDVLTGRRRNDLEDILLADLTVRDILYFTAELRCQRDLSLKAKRARADEVIAQLGLQAKADVVVGSTEKPGISGGQKKRVSIGMDLLANCSVIARPRPATGARPAFAEPASRAGDYDAVFGRYPTSAATQYWILLKRCTLSYLKDEDQSVEHVMPSLMQALVTGLVYLNFSTNLYLATGMCFGVMGACMIAFNAFLLNIPFEKALIVREYKNGSWRRRTGRRG